MHLLTWQGSGTLYYLLQANSVVFSEVPAAAWLHKYVIGKKGVNVRKITEDHPKVCLHLLLYWNLHDAGALLEDIYSMWWMILFKILCLEWSHIQENMLKLSGKKNVL